MLSVRKSVRLYVRQLICLASLGKGKVKEYCKESCKEMVALRIIGKVIRKV